MDRRRLSKAMAYHLRHGTRVALLPGGWAATEELVTALRGSASQADVVAVVERRDNQRFELSDRGRLIRARYGHSREVDLAYEPAAPPAVLLHGTARATVATLLTEGIHRRGRRYVHLSVSPAGARRVGARHGRPAVVRVDAARMAADGHRFFRAADGMWLTLEVPARYVTGAV